MIDLLNSDAIRYAAALQMLFVLGVSVFVDRQYALDAPLPLRAMWRSVLWIVAACTVGLVANAFATIPPTIGAYIVAVSALPSLVVGVYVLHWMFAHLKER